MVKVFVWGVSVDPRWWVHWENYKWSEMPWVMHNKRAGTWVHSYGEIHAMPCHAMLWWDTSDVSIHIVAREGKCSTSEAHTNEHHFVHTRTLACDSDMCAVSWQVEQRHLWVAPCSPRRHHECSSDTKQLDDCLGWGEVIHTLYYTVDMNVSAEGK